MLISHKKFEATYLKHHKEKEIQTFFFLFPSPLLVGQIKRARSSAKCDDSVWRKKLSYPRKREVTTIIYFNPIQPNKKSSKNIFTVLSFHPFCNQPRKWPTTCRQVLLWTVFNSFCDSPRHVLLCCCNHRCCFSFYCFYCFLYKLLCLFFPI